MFHEESPILDLCLSSRGASTLFQGLNGIVGCADPTPGKFCYKDGASTGATVGVIGDTEVHQFRRGTADPGDAADNPILIDHYRLLMLNPFGQDTVCMRGDSGSAFFVSTKTVMDGCGLEISSPW